VDSKLCDVQCGHEKTLTGLVGALAGASYIYGVGLIDAGITMDLAQLVIDDEMVTMLEKTMEGIVVSDDTLMLDEIHAVGSWGDYLSREATVAHARDFSAPKLFERRVYDAWMADGGQDAYECARSKARSILADREVEPLDKDVQREIDAILDAAERSLGATA
jgi:trimethylamine---corrinoid protein Co-methyltransferase